MYQYKVTFSVDGHRTEQVVTARTSVDARRLIEAQYPNSKVIIWNVQRV